MVLKKNVFLKNIMGSFVLLFALSAFSEEAQRTKADTNREVSMTYAQVYLEQRLYEEAEMVLQQSLKNDGQDGSVLNFLGLIQLKQKNFAQACYSFQTAGIVFNELEDRIYALYNLADCFHQGGRKQDAIRVLKDLETKEVGISNSASRVLELLEASVITDGAALPPFQKRARGKFRLFAALSGGFDSNVQLIEETVSRGTSLSQRGSFYLSPSVQFGYAGTLFGKVVDARFVGAFTDYFNSDVNTFNNLYNRVDLFFGTGAVRWDAFADIVFLNNSGFGLYNYDAGLMWQLVKKTKDNDIWTYEAPLRYQKFILASGVSSDNDRSGVDLVARVNYRTQWSESDFLSLTGSLDNQYSVGKNYRLSGLSIPVTVGVSIPGIEKLGLVNTFMAEVGGQIFWQSDLGRRDYWYKAGTGLIAPFFKDWNFTLDYNYFMNNSTVDAATYSKGVISFLLSSDFI